MKRCLCLLLCAVMMLCMSGCCFTLLTAERAVNHVEKDAVQSPAVFEIRDEDGKVWLTGADLASAGAGWFPGASAQEMYPGVTVTFNDRGAALFLQATRENVGRSLEIYVDDELISSPTVNMPIDGGTAIISGDDIATFEDAQRIADAINRAIVYEDSK